MTDTHWNLLIVVLATGVLVTATTGHVAAAIFVTFALLVVGTWRQQV